MHNAERSAAGITQAHPPEPGRPVGLADLATQIHIRRTEMRSTAYAISLRCRTDDQNERLTRWPFPAPIATAGTPQVSYR
jgi:hypothetical protein